MVVFLKLLALGRLGALHLALLDICLQLSDLLVDVGNVLLDDVSEFLYRSSYERSSPLRATPM